MWPLKDVVVIVFVGAMAACAHHSNPQAAAAIARCLDGAELQAETDAQKKNLRRGFDDLATQPPASLRARRYADYQGTPDRWDLPELLKHHLVPREPCGYEAAFWESVDDPRVREAARRLAARLGDYRAAP